MKHCKFLLTISESTSYSSSENILFKILLKVNKLCKGVNISIILVSKMALVRSFMTANSNE